MKSFQFNNLTGHEIANSADYIARKIGASVANCCGSQVVSDIAIDTTNWGLTLAINDQPTTVENGDNFLVESVQVGDFWINMKLRTEADAD